MRSRAPKYIKNCGTLVCRYARVVESSVSGVGGGYNWLWIIYLGGITAYVHWPQTNLEEISKEEYLISSVLES